MSTHAGEQQKIKYKNVMQRVPFKTIKLKSKRGKRDDIFTQTHTLIQRNCTRFPCCCCDEAEAY